LRLLLQDVFLSSIKRILPDEVSQDYANGKVFYREYCRERTIHRFFQICAGINNCYFIQRYIGLVRNEEREEPDKALLLLQSPEAKFRVYKGRIPYEVSQDYQNGKVFYSGKINMWSTSNP
jgi:hypothetical protein